MTDVTTTPRFERVSAGHQMSIDPVSIQIGGCYIVTTGRVRRVTDIEAGRVFYEERRGPVREGYPWPRRASTSLREFAAKVVRGVECSHTAEANEHQPAARTSQRDCGSMSIEPEAVRVGQCYLTETGKIRRVTALPPGRVQFEQRNAAVYRALGWQTDILDLRSFAFTVERPVPCDWTPEKDEA